MKTRRSPEQRKQLREKPRPLSQRKHLEWDERQRFLSATALLPPKRQIFCEIICYTGCRIQEAHDLCSSDFNLTKSLISFECLKLREDGVFRHVPVDPDWIKKATRLLQLDDLSPYDCVWDFSLSTGFRSVKKAMKLAKIDAPYANARGLRHSFCTLHTNNKTDPDWVKYWAGHRSLKTTSIYIGKMNTDEHTAAKALW